MSTELERTDAIVFHHTRIAFLWTRFLSMPFWTLISLFAVFLYKDFHITPLQVSLLVAIKPLSALIAPYWSLSIYQRQDRLTSNLVWANLLRYSPFLFFPWIDSVWLMILAFTIYMVLRRGATPAWMEMFKKNIPEVTREKVFIYGTALDYLGSAILPVLLGLVLDQYLLSWRWLFAITASIGILSTFLLWRIPPPFLPNYEKNESSLSLKERLLSPIKQSWQLMKDRPDFAKFQIGFMLGGGGLMVIQPVLPIFFVDVLQLSYTNLLLAMVACKGIGFALASPFWLKYFRKWSIFSFSSAVIFCAALFPLCLLLAKYQIALIYLAYILYGIMQAGSELSWNMSGPIFSGEGDSTLFTRTNVLSVGLRGAVLPAFGSCLYACSNATAVLFISLIFFLEATRRFKYYGTQSVERGIGN